MKHFAIAGRLGSQPSLNRKGDTVWTNLNIAVNGKDENPDWFWVTAFGKLAEACAAHLSVGDGVSVSGELRSKKLDEKTHYDLIARQATFFFKDSRTTPGSENPTEDPGDAPAGDVPDDEVDS